MLWASTWLPQDELQNAKEFLLKFKSEQAKWTDADEYW